jgi:hypothetical protein
MEKTISLEQAEMDLIYYLEMGDLFGSQGKGQEALDFYMQGFKRAKDAQDKARIQQFSNLIYAYI